MLDIERPPDISTSVDFAFVATKVRGRHRKLYEGDKLTALTRLHSLGDIGSELLGQREFVDHLDLERRIIALHVGELLSIQQLVSGARRDLVDWLMGRHQLENIKVIARSAAAGIPLSATKPYLVELPQPLAIDISGLPETPTPAQIVQLIPQRAIAAGAAASLDDFQKSGKAYIIESAIDKEYFNGLADHLAALGGTDRESCGPLINLEVDIYNVLLILRGRFNYGLKADETESLLAARAGGLSITELRRILNLDKPEEAIDAIPAKLIGREAAPRDIGDIETILWRRLAHLAVRTYYASLFDLGIVLGFMYIKRVELMNLIRIVEMVRLKRSPEAIQERLVPAK